MSTVKTLLNKIDRYHHLKDLATEQWNDIKEYSKFIDLSEVKAMSYEDIKSLMSKTLYMIDDNTNKELSKIYHAKRRELYPQAYGVKYYPELKEIDFLSEEKKELLDNCLNNMRIGDYTYIIKNKFYDREIRRKIHDFLYEKGIVKKMYGLICNGCGCPGEWISEEEYDFIKRNFGLPYKERDENFYGYFSMSCMDCDDSYIEVETLEEFEKIKYEISCKKIKESDRSTDSL